MNVISSECKYGKDPCVIRLANGIAISANERLENCIGKFFYMICLLTRDVRTRIKYILLTTIYERSMCFVFLPQSNTSTRMQTLASLQRILREGIYIIE